MRNLILISLSILLTIFVSCTAPKELVQLYQTVDTTKSEYSTSDFVIFPSSDFEQWLTDMQKFHRNIPTEVERNQLGMSITDNETGEHIYVINPSARPNVMIDTLLAMHDINDIIGNWQEVRYQRILYKDSVSFIDSTITRTTKLLGDIIGETIISFNDKTMRMYNKSKKSGKFIKINQRKYKVIEGHYLLIYNKLHTTSGTSFIGLSENNELVWDNYFVRNTLLPNKYKLYTTVATRIILRKIPLD